ncbi:MAG: C25 family cysteine peptidase [Cytophagales bacterium]
MKKILYVLLFFTIQLFCQTNWFNYNQTYLKFTVSEKGIYKIPASVVSELSGTFWEVDKLQLFYKGHQIAIKTLDSNQNNIFDEHDYVLFFGNKNNGLLDQQLYTQSSYHLNPAINLFADSSAYFLTYSDSGPYKRLKDVSNSSNFEKIKEHLNTKRIDYETSYSRGRKMLSDEPVYGSLYGASVGYGQALGSSNSWGQDYQYDSLVLNNLVLNSPTNISVESKLLAYDLPYSMEIETYSKFGFRGQENLIAQSTILNLVPVTVQKNLQTPITTSSNTLWIRNKIINNTTESIFGVAYHQVKYPQEIVWDQTSSKVYEILGTSKQNYKLVIPTTGILQAWIINSDTLTTSINITDSSNSSILYFENQFGNDQIFVTKTITEISKGRKIVFSEIKPKRNLFVIVSNKFLEKPSSSYSNPVRAYAAYRASVAGGSYDTLVYDTDYLYDYYTYGEHSPLAIRKLCQTLSPDTAYKPKGMLLIGKGYNKVTSGGNLYMGKLNSLVPVWGNPGSDVAFTIGLAGSPSMAGAFPIGRLSAYNSQHVENYLNKLKEHEALSDNTDWKKNIIHVSGGKTNAESGWFKSILASMAVTAKGPYFGGNVSAYAKTTDEFVQVFDLSTYLDKGTSLVNILGHSSTFTNDVRIGAVTDPLYNYKNKGKYPIILLNGCESGNIFAYNDIGFEPFSESWINEPNVGSIGFYAHASIGFVNQFDTYDNKLYYNWFAKDSLSINKTIGDVIVETSKEHVNGYTDYSSYNVIHAHQMVYMGDPLVRIFKSNNVDLEIRSSEVQFIVPNNKPLTALTDSVQIKFVVHNLVMIPKNKYVNISIKRTKPNGTEVLVKNLYVNFQTSSDTFSVYMPLADIYSAGENTITIQVNANSTISESNLSNNSVSIVRYLPASDMNCLFPKEFSIQNKSTLNLVAQSTDLLKTNTEYFIEIDTSFTFKSPAYQSKTITATSLPTWENIDLLANLPMNSDSVEFFWRIKFKADGDTTALYSNSSFLYINNGSPGWNQSKYHQFDKDVLSDNLLRNDSTNAFDFVSYKLNIEASAGRQALYSVLDSNQLMINNKVIYSSSWLPKFFDGWNPYTGYILSAYDSKTLRIYSPSGYQDPTQWYGAGISTEYAISKYLFSWDGGRNTILDAMIAAIEAVPEGDYILINPMNSISFQGYDSTAKAKLQYIADLIGSTKFGPQLTSEFFYAAFVRKGYGIVKDSLFLNPTDADRFKFKVNQELFFPDATITSTLIGPAISWGNFYFNIDKDNSKDTVNFDIYGVSDAGTSTKIFSNTTENALSLAGINAEQYPYLKIVANMSDYGAFTPPIIDRWMVTYGDSIPEGTLVIDKTKQTYGTLYKAEGDSIKSDIDFKNIGKTAFLNPLIVRYTLKSAKGISIISYDTLAVALKTNQSITLKKAYSTINLSGKYTLEVYVNPKIQKEELYTNNVWTSAIEIQKDVTNPILDVTFDGRKILNGEIVSPSPFIQISIYDDNKYLLKQDTTGIKVLLKKNCTGCDNFSLVPFTSNLIKYYPATSSDKTFRIDYNPQNLEDGSYTLCLQGADASENYSGLSPYCIEFTVVNQSTMSQVFPYPNPFTNSCKFVFTITGSEVPDQLKIQIMTVSGKVVREITQSEIGPLHIGTNISDYSWDGTDEFGDKLANGVYLYKVYAKHSGQKYDKMTTGAEKAFKQDWGKLVILR